MPRNVTRSCVKEMQIDWIKLRESTLLKQKNVTSAVDRCPLAALFPAENIEFSLACKVGDIYNYGCLM